MMLMTDNASTTACGIGGSNQHKKRQIAENVGDDDDGLFPAPIGPVSRSQPNNFLHDDDAESIHSRNGVDLLEPSQPPTKKRQRFQRRNSKTSAMLLNQLDVFATTVGKIDDNDDDDDNISSKTRATISSSTNKTEAVKRVG